MLHLGSHGLFVFDGRCVICGAVVAAKILVVAHAELLLQANVTNRRHIMLRKAWLQVLA